MGNTASRRDVLSGMRERNGHDDVSKGNLSLHCLTSFEQLLSYTKKRLDRHPSANARSKHIAC